MILLQPTYFSPIIQYVAIAKSQQITFEVEDNFQKQTYRSRCYISTSAGKLPLNVPIQHLKGFKQKTKDIKIDYKDGWNKLHLKTLETAYSSSPFFEFYIDDLLPIFKNKYDFLLDFNLKTFEFIMDALQHKLPYSITKEYQTNIEYTDLRNLALAKTTTTFELEKYTQVFNENHDFLSNLSILDLLFMEGPNTLNYLESQKITF